MGPLELSVESDAGRPVRRALVNFLTKHFAYSNLLDHLPKSECTPDVPDEVVILCLNRIMFDHVNVTATEVPAILIPGQ
jgi:hypothetical protein